MRSAFRTAAAAVAASVVLALVAGCGDDGAGTPEAQPGPASAPAPGEASPAVPEGVAQQYATLEREVAAEGGETRSGDWRVAYIVEPAESWFEPVGGNLRFRQPAPGETHHIEVIPIEAKSGRIVPQVPIQLEVLNATGQVVDAKPLNFYYSEFFHYANNFSVPTAGRYTLRATLAPPTFFRHGEQGEQPPLGQGTTVEFRDVELRPEPAG